MKISEHIKTLLFQEDCVIIPGFGGFVGKYQEAKVDFNKSQLSPPLKVIAFNQKLQENDGLLIKHIAKTEELNYQQAEIQVQEFANRLKTALKQGKKVRLPEIGSFKFEKTNLVFTPENSLNFHSDAFGLDRFEFPMLSNARKQIPIRKKQLEPVKNKKRRPKLIPLLIGLPLIALLIYSPIYFQNSESIKTQETAGLSIPIKTQKQATETNRIKLHKKQLEINEEIASVSEKQMIDESSPKQPTITPIIKGNVHIIAGSFSSSKNAENAANELIKKGYEAMVMPAPKGMHRVSLKTFNTKEQAFSNLNQLRSDLNNDGLWVLKL